MKRATVGTLVFVGAALALGMSPTETPVAEAGTGPSLPAVTASKSDVVTADTITENIRTSQRSVVKAAEIDATTGGCAAGMVEVEGDYCPDSGLEQKCLKYIDPENVFPRRCAEFAPSGACQTKTAKKHFCIDRYEYPNKVGEKPIVMKTWYEAGDACKAQGKRLCGDSEWTVACEGQERLPYPYGTTRNSEACNIDKPHPNVNEAALANPYTRDAEVARLWQGEESGSREGCTSPFGVHDMTGNVDEWVVNESGLPYKSGLKGGYWGPVRDRCRPMTTAHYEQFSFYQIGFRCCSDAPTSGNEGGEAKQDGSGKSGNGAGGGSAVKSAPVKTALAGS